MENYYLILDGLGNIAGSGLTLDETIPAGRVACTQVQAQKPFDWAVVNGEIVPSPNLLANAQVAQISILSSACQQQIISGFSSSALGSVYIYASNDVDQRNILLAAQVTTGGIISYRDSSGVWYRKNHTQAQAQQVALDFVAMSDANRNKLTTLETQVNAATTVEEVQSIVW